MTSLGCWCGCYLCISGKYPPEPRRWLVLAFCGVGWVTIHLEQIKAATSHANGSPCCWSCWAGWCGVAHGVMDCGQHVGQHVWQGGG